MQYGPATLKILAEMGEWMAYGFYEAIDLPWPRSFGRAFRRLYENMDIRLPSLLSSEEGEKEGIPSDRLLLPFEPFPCLRTQASHGAHHATGFICDFMHHCGLHVNDEIVAEKKAQFPQYAAFIDDLAADLAKRLPVYGGYTHANPDIQRVVTQGFNAMERELDEQIACVDLEQGAGAGENEMHLLAALKDYTLGVRAFYTRTLVALQAACDQPGVPADLITIKDAFAGCFLNPSKTFLQGLLAVHFTWLLDGCDSIGRVDQVLGGLFTADLQAGRLEIGLARRLLDEFFADFERLNGWNWQIGGYRADGVDGYNTLTREMILACQRNKFRRPNVAFRITQHTPREALMDVMKALREGTGRPALYNDDLYIRTLLNLDLGLTPEDAREMGFGGCTETMIPGMSNVGSLEGDLNLAKALELALHDGLDPLTGQQDGPHTGRFIDFPDFNAFTKAVQRQIEYMTDAFVSDHTRQLRKRFTEGDPKLYRTFFTRDCIQRRKSFEAGGARYNWSIVNYAGIGNLIDGLAAVRRCVFDDRSVSAGDLLAALADDFTDWDEVRKKLQAAPKFGNDDPYVDTVGQEILRFTWEELIAHGNPRGGRYLPGCLMFTTYGYFGSFVGALPDGRKARTVLADSTGPVQGCDTHGPTAMLKSVAKLPLSLAVGTPVLNIRFQKHFLETGTGLEACINLVRTYFDMGGMQIQVSVLSTEEMRAAQVEPEKYADLIVRIGGYSEYFTKLDRGLQDSVIARTEHSA